jgi:hypothetical protein
MPDPNNRPRMTQTEARVQMDQGRGGLVCPGCGCRDFRVVYTRPKPDGKILRRRRCRHCGRRITTFERV